MHQVMVFCRFLGKVMVFCRLQVVVLCYDSSELSFDLGRLWCFFFKVEANADFVLYILFFPFLTSELSLLCTGCLLC